MKVLVAEVLKPASPQFEVPEVIPNVCDPKVPLVVAARTWIIPGWSPKIIEPRPHPAVPYVDFPCAAGFSARAIPAPRITARNSPKRAPRIRRSFVWKSPSRNGGDTLHQAVHAV
jgi:hypothetical protein